ncbi:uncharacterized protein CC84DRAFT_1212703 [Paraphaeosphaeria sporulosa]|uniref:Uncharacterized protein n=1 Tax=Paraphaeosphaeria sporulosa TaxID=1460663 RepID=A0A177CQN1_9PLEO|nr:uncharacterized protein CC84DRAFT_1212703 [Paraphaeosphaeria sporulosa]OAG09252.1 hypothetical protein CC84DRAFT_1212703 [Paraphaeosphaeria sporulosa]
MCGPSLLSGNPGFPRTFGIFCDSLPTYMKRVPRLTARRAYAAQDECVEAVLNWQTWSARTFNAGTTPMDEGGNDGIWGSTFFRERYKTFIHDMGFDARDMAAMELGFLFG